MTPIDHQAASLAVRRERSRLRKQVERYAGKGCRDAGMLTLAEVLAAKPDCLQRTSLWDALHWVPRVTDGDVRKLMRDADIHSDYRLIGELSSRQLDLLLHALRSPVLNGTMEDAA